VFDSSPKSREHQVRLSAFIHGQNTAGVVPNLTADLVAQVERVPIPRLRERSLRALAAMAEEVGNRSQPIRCFGKMPAIQAISYSADEDELWLLICILERDGFVNLRDHGFANLTIEGILKAEDLSSQGSPHLQGFVAMSFDSTMDEAYTLGFYLGITNAGYSAIRIDKEQHINGITDEILVQIRRSRFVVADYTHMNNGVYFEAGVAVRLGIPVIATCRADHLDKLHFDIISLSS